MKCRICRHDAVVHNLGTGACAYADRDGWDCSCIAFRPEENPEGPPNTWVHPLLGDTGIPTTQPPPKWNASLVWRALFGPSMDGTEENMRGRGDHLNPKNDRQKAVEALMALPMLEFVKGLDQVARLLGGTTADGYERMRELSESFGDLRQRITCERPIMPIQVPTTTLPLPDEAS